MRRPIHLVVPDPGPDCPEPGEAVTPLFIEPEGATPGRETPGFFILAIGGNLVLSGLGAEPELPRQFLSLRAVNDYLNERYGRAPPLRVSRHVAIEHGAAQDFPAIWQGTRGKSKARVPITVRYIGSFRYWDGRRVDPTKVGTPEEFN